MLDLDDLLEDAPPLVYDLERATFVFKGKSVPGSKLAALLGLTSDAESEETGEEASQENRKA